LDKFIIKKSMQQLKIITDQMERQIEVPFPPKRIISLVPSQTELLYDLGLHDEVVGQTLFCVHPNEMHNSKPRIGGTKKLQMDKIAALEPDLIIGNKEENEQSQIEELMKLYPVWMSDIKNLDDSIDMIERIGDLIGRNSEAMNISQKIRNDFNELMSINKQLSTNRSVLYLIWRKPWMAAGLDTFINDMLQRSCFENSISSPVARYPDISNDEIRNMKPNYIFLSSEPYPFKDEHISELQALSPSSKILLVDGEMFSWYGSRLLKSASYFKELFNSL
jgi:ABC-type Fe3+-hydroxamate transport system substrate-binding protein